MASWAPQNKVNPSATTSTLLLSKTLKAARSKSLTKTFVDTRRSELRPPPEDIHGVPEPRLGARCTMMAKRVELAATSASTQNQKGEMQPSSLTIPSKKAISKPASANSC